jgi:hypothetical protein
MKRIFATQQNEHSNGSDNGVEGTSRIEKRQNEVIIIIF